MAVLPTTVEDVRLIIELAREPTGRPEEAVVLRLRGRDAETGGDERRYLGPLERLLASEPQRPHLVTVTRRSGTWGEEQASLHIGVRLEAPRSTNAGVDLVAMLREVLGDRPEPGADPLPRDAAIAEARAAVEAVWGREPGDLVVTEEEHRHADRLWLVDLRAEDGARYDVRVGVVGGSPATAHARRVQEAEVVDSIGTE